MREQRPGLDGLFPIFERFSLRLTGVGLELRFLEFFALGGVASLESVRLWRVRLRAARRLIDVSLSLLSEESDFASLEFLVEEVRLLERCLEELGLDRTWCVSYSRSVVLMKFLVSCMDIS